MTAALVFGACCVLFVFGVAFARHASRDRWPRWWAPIEDHTAHVRTLPREAEE